MRGKIHLSHPEQITAALQLLYAWTTLSSGFSRDENPPPTERV
jgi:hypothetical protein